MIKQKSKKDKPFTTGKQRFEVLLEDMNDKIVVMAEQSTQQTSDIKKIKETLEQNTEQFEKIDMNIEIIKMDISTIKNDLKQKVNLEDFKKLEQRVAMLESRRA